MLICVGQISTLFASKNHRADKGVRMNVIEVKNLSKSYGHIKAVDDISFYVEKGTLFAFLGPNGAGKSTTIDVLCTFLQPDNGEATINGFVLGKQDKEIRATIGTVFQDGVLDKLLTVEENLKLRGGLYGLKGKALAERVQKATVAAEVGDLLKRPYGKLSGGQRRRADIARALMNTPKILFLDEPTTGLDPQTRKKVWETISRLQKEGDMTVFMTTHYMEEAADADYVVVIDNGKIAAKGTPSDIKERYATDKIRLSFTQENETALKAVLASMQLEYSQAGRQLTIKIATTMDALPILKKCQKLVDCFEVLGGTMDDAFIGITGKELRE